MTTPYPLAWPTGVERTPAGKRQRSPFRTSLSKATANLKGSLRLFQKDAGVQIENVVLSTDCDFIREKPADPGAAVWFRMDGQLVCFAIDRFLDLAANVQALHHVIEARRTELRYGGLRIVKQTFRAFFALPAPSQSGRSCWEVLGIAETSDLAAIRAAYRKAAKIAHPDAGGSHEAMSELNEALMRAERNAEAA